MLAEWQSFRGWGVGHSDSSGVSLKLKKQYPAERAPMVTIRLELDKKQCLHFVTVSCLRFVNPKYCRKRISKPRYAVKAVISDKSYSNQTCNLIQGKPIPRPLLMGKINKGPKAGTIFGSRLSLYRVSNLEEPRLCPGSTLNCMLETLVTAMQTRGPAFVDPSHTLEL